MSSLEDLKLSCALRITNFLSRRVVQDWLKRMLRGLSCDSNMVVPWHMRQTLYLLKFGCLHQHRDPISIPCLLMNCDFHKDFLILFQYFVQWIVSIFNLFKETFPVNQFNNGVFVSLSHNKVLAFIFKFSHVRISVNFYVVI